MMDKVVAGRVPARRRNVGGVTGSGSFNRISKRSNSHIQSIIQPSNHPFSPATFEKREKGQAGILPSDRIGSNMFSFNPLFFPCNRGNTKGS